MTTQPPDKSGLQSQLKRAQKGDTATISTMINGSFQKQGLRAEVVANGRFLEVSLYGQTPPSKRYIDVLKAGLTRMGVTRFTHLVVDSNQQDASFPAWVETIALSDYEPIPPPPSIWQRSIKATTAKYQPQWQAQARFLPPFLQDFRIFAVVFLVGWLLLIFKPVIFVGLALPIASVGWLRYRDRPQALPTVLQRLPAWFTQFQEEWILALFGGYGLVLRSQWVAYGVIALALVALVKLLYTALTSGRNRAARVDDALLVANLHGVLLGLSLSLAIPTLSSDLLSTFIVGLGLGFAVQLGYRLKSVAIIANVLLTLSSLVFVMLRMLPAAYTAGDRPYYDTEGYNIVFGLFVLVAAGLYLGLVAIGSFLCWGMGRGIFRNDQVGYGCLLASPYLAWAYVLTIFAPNT